MRLSYNELNQYRNMVTENKDLLEWRESIGGVKGMSYDAPRVQTSGNSTLDQVIEARERITQIIEKRIEDNQAQLLRIIEFIEGERDADTRLYMRKFFIEGWTWTKIADTYHVDRSTIAKRVKRAIERRY